MAKVMRFLSSFQEICVDLRSNASEKYDEVITKHPAEFYSGTVGCAKKSTG